MYLFVCYCISLNGSVAATKRRSDDAKTDFAVRTNQTVLYHPNLACRFYDVPCNCSHVLLDTRKYRVRKTSFGTLFLSRLVPVRPKVSCPAAQLSPAFVEGLKLTCTVRANPQSKFVAWSWQKTDGTVMTLKAGETAGSYSAIVEDGVMKPQRNDCIFFSNVYYKV